MRRTSLAGSLAIAAFVLTGCARTPAVFSEQNARAHVGMLAGTIGSRSAGSPPNARARAYIVEQLKQLGFDVRVQETDARRRDLGHVVRVANIVGILAGQRTEAVGLLSHFDSVAEAPGAADDALGVAVALETARLFAARPNRRWSLFVLVTDAEESGLMGAAALVGERDITDRLKAYINIEAIGSAGVPVLFETGPGNGWLTAVWARSAPHPRGGSYAIEIYKRLPNDTDFSIIKTQDIPGLNFAAVKDSYSYHTPRDTAERLSPHTIRTMGENAIAIVDALQSVDITERSTADRTFFDIAGTIGVSYGPGLSATIALSALVLGFLAWARVMRGVILSAGFGRWLLLVIWVAVSAAAVVGAMIGAVWLLRAAREVYHPWYAHPGRMFLLMLTAGVTGGWTLARAGRLLPAGAHAPRHPAMTWSVTLPVWLLAAAGAIWSAPSAAYLWTWPLLVAGMLFALTPSLKDGPMRAASVVVLAVTGTLWLRESLELAQFMVTVTGRLPIITPVFLYPALACTAGIVVAPPFIAAVAPSHALVRPSIVTALLLLATAGAAVFAYSAPAYTHERPLRRHARAFQEAAGTAAIWEVASVEPGLDLRESAPAGFTRVDGTPPAGAPWGRLGFPFVFRATAGSLGPPPAAVSTFTTTVLEQGSEAAITVVPHVPGVTIRFVLPPNLVPARSNLPGVVRSGRWTATFVAPPADGLSWRASFTSTPPQTLDGIVVAATMPWGMQPPSWLPQDLSVWSGGATWLLPRPLPAVAPMPSLR
jgi:Peptidase family M28